MSDSSKGEGEIKVTTGSSGWVRLVCPELRLVEDIFGTNPLFGPVFARKCFCETYDSTHAKASSAQQTYSRLFL